MQACRESAIPPGKEDKDFERTGKFPLRQFRQLNMLTGKFNAQQLSLLSLVNCSNKLQIILNQRIIYQYLESKLLPFEFYTRVKIVFFSFTNSDKSVFV